MNIQRPLGKYATSSLAYGCLIFFATLIIFTISRVHQVADSQYSMMVSQSLLNHRTFALDHYTLPRHEPVWHGYYFRHGPIYQLEVAQGRIYYHFPPGTSILSAPFVAALNVFGVSAVNHDGTYNPRGEVRLEAAIAALLMATLATIFFFTARLLLPPRWSAAVAIGGALGTQVYSTASRALWSETWGIFLLGIVILLLLAVETGRARFRPILTASILSWMFFVRPTFAIPVIAISVYVLLFCRQMFVRYALTGAAWLAGFVAYSWIHFHQLLPSYYRASRISTTTFWTALAGNLVSPARGLLVYVPVLLFVAYLLIAYRSKIRHRRLLFLSLAVIAAHLLLISGFPHWWGGHSFGPRFTTGLVPWFVLLAILGLDAMLTSQRRHSTTRSLRWQAQLIVGVVLLVASMFIHTRGAASHATWRWNQKPKGIDEHPERLWDWRQPQFLAGYLPYPAPREFPLLVDGELAITNAEMDRVLWYGWIQGTEREVWAEKDAALVFRLTDRNATTIQMTMVPFIVPGKLDAQRVKVTLNEVPLTELTLNENSPRVYSLVLPAEALRENNSLVFHAPGAESPLKLGAGDDPRPRSFRLISIRK